MKKKLLTGMLIAVTMAVSLTGCKKDEITSYSSMQESSAGEETGTNQEEQQNEQRVYKIAEYTFYDATGELDEETISLYETEIKAFADNYIGTLFNINEETADYTDKLLAMHGTSGYFKGGDNTVAQNAYILFSAVNHKSEVSEVRIDQIIVTPDTIIPQVSVVGSVFYTAESDKLESGRYASAFTCVLMREDNAWKACDMSIVEVYNADSYAMVRPDENKPRALASAGKVVHKYNFGDIEGYYTDYTYNNPVSVDPADYDEVKVYKPSN